MNWDKITKFEGPKESPGFLLWQVSTLWRRQIEAALREHNLTHIQFVLLAGVGWLGRTGDEVIQAQLSEHSGTDINMTSQVVRTLERKGYVMREKSQRDPRANALKLTPHGKRMVQKTIPVVEAVDAKFFGESGESTVECLSGLMEGE